MTFNLTGDRTKPVNYVDQSSKFYGDLLTYLPLLKEHGLLDSCEKYATIIYTEDQFINQQSMKMNF